MADLLAEGTAVFTSWLDTLPEAAREPVKAATTPDALKKLGEMALSRADYSKKMNEADQTIAKAQKDYENLQAWYAANKETLDLGTKAKASGWDPAQAIHRGEDGAAASPATLPADVVRKDDLYKFVNEREYGAARYFSALQKLSFGHYQQFGEPLDTDALLADPRLEKLGLDGVYKAQHGERVAQRVKDLADKDFNDRVNAAVAERLRHGHRPVDATSADADLSPLTALEPQTTKGTSGVSAEELADEYERLVAARS